MNIRLGKLEDTENIINVLKLSLGETKLPKSKSIWIYKHFDNPFGNSLIIVAEENNKIVGVRALMQFKWHSGEKVYKTLRAVDTGVLPEFQGKGIFNEMNNFAIKLAKENQYSFIFNTPNIKSLPGNLKLGWEKIDHVKVGLKLYPAIFKNPGKNVSLLDSENIESVNDFLKIHEGYNKKNGQLYIPKSFDYLKWRYRDNPLQNYQCYFNSHYFLAIYEKKHSKFTELRVSDCLYNDEFSKNKMEIFIKNYAFTRKIRIITFSSNLDLFKIKLNLKIGPILVIKSFSEISSERNFDNLSNWNYQLGDLELF